MVSGMAVPSSPAVPPPRRRVPLRAAIIGLGAVAVVAAGVGYLRWHEAGVRRDVERRLAALVENNVRQIELWRHERIADGRVAARVAWLAETAVPGGDAAARERLRRYAEELVDAYGYAAVALHGRDGRERLRVPAEGGPGPALTAAQVAEAAQATQPDLGELQVATDGAAYLDVLVPLRAADGLGSAGVLQLRMDARRHLLRLLGESARQEPNVETLLVRKDGEGVLILSEQGGRGGAGGVLRVPLADKDLMAVRAVQDNPPGLTEARDFRGAAVVALVRAVPGTTWRLVAKQDREELAARVRDEAVRVIVAGGLLLALGVVLAQRYWRARERAADERRETAERSREAAMERLGLVMRHAHDAILLFDAEGRVVEANEAACRVYGETVAGMLRLTVRDLRAPSEQATLSEQFLAALRESGLIFETVHRRRDGTEFPAEVSAQPVTVDGRPHVLSIVRDITERRAHEREIERLNRVYQVISAVNQAIVHRSERGALLAEIGRVMVEVGGYRFAWFGWLDEATGLIEPVAVHGDEHGYVQGLRISCRADVPEGQGPSGRAFRDGRTHVCNDFFADPATAPWRERAERSGVRASIALPVKEAGRVRGLLTVYAGEKNCFGPGEVRLLEEAAGDVSFALEVFAGDAQRRKTEAEYRKLSRAIEQAPLCVAITDLDGKIEYVNPKFREVTGYAASEVLGQNPRVLKSGQTPPDVYAEMWATLTRGQVWRGELHNKKKNGEVYVEMAVIAPVVGDDGRATHYVALKEDITESRRTQVALRESEERYRLIAENTSDAIWIVALDTGRFTYVSAAVRRMLGYAPEELIGQEFGRVLTAEARQAATASMAARMQAFDAGDAALRNLTLQLDHRRRDGGIVRGDVVTTLLADAAGRPTHVLGVSRDVTERRAAEDALRHSLDRLARAEQMAQLGNWELDADGGQVSLSVEARRIYEVSPDRERYPPAELFARVDPADQRRVEEAIGSARPAGTKGFAGFRLRLPGGRVKYVEAAGEPTAGPDGAVRLVGTVQDVTERKRVELELHGLVKELKAFHAVSLAMNQRELPLEELLARVVSQVPMALRTPASLRAEIQFAGRTVRAGADGEAAASLAVPVTVNGRTAGRVAVAAVRAGADGDADAAFSSQEREFVESLVRTLELGLGERESFEQVRRSEERFRAIFDHAEVGMFETTVDGRVTRANPYLGRLLGTPADGLAGLHWTEFAGDGEPGGAPPVEASERRCRRRDGGEFWGLVNARLERDAAGAPTGYICLLQDVSGQVAARDTLVRFNTELENKVAQRTAELAARNREVQALLQAVPDVVMRVRRDGTLLHCQRAHGSAELDALVAPAADGVPVPAAELLGPSRELGRQALELGTAVAADAQVASPAGELALELRAAPIGAEEFVVFVRDITARKRLEAETAAMLEREREVSQMKTRFISVTSHEFRTPMAAVMGSAELLANHYDRLAPEKRDELFERINGSLRRMTEMLDDVLTLNRLDARRTVAVPAPFDLRLHLQNVVDEARLADRDGHRFVLVAAAESVPVVADASLLHHILSNLLSNAVRYSPGGRTITVRLEAGAERVRIAVEDEGIGIPAEDRARIFEAFERGSNVGHIKGTGLGLNIVHRMTDLLGGKIEVDGRPAGGSDFTVELPRTPTATHR